MDEDTDEEDPERRRLTIVTDEEVQGELDDWFPVQPTYDSEPAEQAEIARGAAQEAPLATERARALAAKPTVVSEATKAAVARVAAAIAVAAQNTGMLPSEVKQAASYIAELAQTASTVAKPPPPSPPKPWFWPVRLSEIEKLVLPLIRAGTCNLDKNQYEQHIELFEWYRKAEEVLLGFLERRPHLSPEEHLQNWELFRRLIKAAQQPYKFDSQRLHQLDNAVALTHVFVLHERTNEWTEPVKIDDTNWPVPDMPWEAPQPIETDPHEPIRLPMLGAGFFVERCVRARMEYKIYDHPACDVLVKKLGKAGADQWRPKPWQLWSVTRRTLAYSIDHLLKFRQDVGFRYCVQRHRSSAFKAHWHQLVSNLEDSLPLVATFYQASAIDGLRAIDGQSRALLDRLTNPDRTVAPRGPFVPHIRPDEPPETVEGRERRLGAERFRREQTTIAKTQSKNG